jgi:opacity protein-like surface antigen
MGGFLFSAEVARPRAALPIRFLLTFSFLIFNAVGAWSQVPDTSPYYARRNAFSLFTAYANDSSHILLGQSDNRKLLDIGVAYSRRLILGRFVNWQYNAEILPVALESDPVILNTVNWTSPTVRTETGSVIEIGPCVPSSGSYSATQNGVTYSYNYTFTCGRRWTIGEAMSPIGLEWNFMPRRKVQPFAIGHGGYMYSTQPIPIPNAGSFNFTFDVGAGIEWFHSQSRSMRLEYRYHHISNHNTAMENPGIDNGLYQVTYSFGR